MDESGHLRKLTVTRAAVVLALIAGATVAAIIATGTASSPQPSAHVSRLEARLSVISQRAAVESGDPDASDRLAVGPVPADRANRETSGDEVSSTAPVYVIELRGDFTCGACSVPAGGRAPTGHVMTLYVYARSFSEEGFGLGNKWSDLSRLGTPFHLVRPSRG